MPPFRDPHGMSIAHATCDHSLSALSNPPDFVAALCRDDTIAVDICINGQLLYYCHFFCANCFKLPYIPYYLEKRYYFRVSLAKEATFYIR